MLCSKSVPVGGAVAPSHCQTTASKKEEEEPEEEHKFLCGPHLNLILHIAVLSVLLAFSHLIIKTSYAMR